ncbi:MULTISPECIES: 16S rRNA (guanine(1207)-N(2))-methyltransferase RsmC [unclassified Motilimonas]|uniref:16S rRNA (guanine(1207)-N(2))-methyltransferase RsmC n=1 Tax=Motilimonas TaxID=1914248 RepID=UPI001E32ACAF|nr:MULTISPECIES: 16S rRNA (guanine(1207)-N(2))-methyltransferase RsmC [unclassified Motilimonas]MCE0558208.1 16S rRNA (guanine(1207)-N(2))-methyltransferase RsmC [Motilimonas sp. E26]MDO6526388.1 16S rRNA (guanine(1207)-N(2))-methyltransferase RsmC [Motilimonas sp. 1_MG-2023]
MTAISSSPTSASQVLERNISQFNDKSVLVTGAIEDTYAIELANSCRSVHVFTTYYSAYQALQQSDQIGLSFGASFAPESPLEVDAAILYLPKTKAEVDYLLANVVPQIKIGGILYLVGDNRGGIKSVDKQLQPYGNKAIKLDSARRCSLLALEISQQCQPFQLDDWLTTYPCEVKGEHLDIVSLPGVFSAKELDLGTRLLLENIAPLKGNALDIGCGAGVIGSFLLKQNPELKVEMTDVSALAVESAKLTLAKNGLNAHVFPSDVYSEVKQRYTTLISNPPFHAGLNTNYGAVEQIIADAKQHLKIRGRLILVANKFLRYEPLFEKAFTHCELLTETTKFKLLSNYPD